MTQGRDKNSNSENNSIVDPARKRLKCSIVVMAHNEEKNIAHLINRLLSQRLKTVEITEIIIIASGCSDSTEAIAQTFFNENPALRLISEPERNGKADAVNRFISEASENLLVSIGADTLPDYNAVELLVNALDSPCAGIAGAHPVPLNSTGDFPGYVVHFLWEMHHQLALQMPKCGEMIAFKKVFSELPPDTIVDEPQIEALICAAGLDIVYVPDAIVYNLGPSSLHEIIMRRSNIVAGYARLSKRTKYRVAHHHLRWWLIRYVAGRVIRREEPLFRASGAILIELIARLIGNWTAATSKKPLHVWPHATSTKSPAEFLEEK